MHAFRCWYLKRGINAITGRSLAGSELCVSRMQLMLQLPGT